MMLKFSLVTTCRNEIDSLPRWMQDVLAQTRQPDEIVIVDAFSDDGTAEMLREWAEQDARIVVIQAEGSAARGRNLAIERAKHEHVLSTDMGVRLCPVWCLELIKPFESDPEVQIVAGSTQIDRDTVRTAVARAEYYLADGGEPRLGHGFVPSNRSVAYTKRVWRELGGLPEDLTFYADDSVFGRQMVLAGYKMAYAPKAMTYWGRPRRLTDFYREVYGYGYGDGEAAIKMPFAFRLHLKGWVPRCLVPLLTGCRVLQKQGSWKALKNALQHLDLGAVFYMVPLLFGKGYCFGKAYVKGYARGEQHCVACRFRVKDWYQVSHD